MEWAARSDHLRGIPRKTVIMAVSAFARAVANLCNKTTVHNADTLMTLVQSRPPGVPLITVSNHMSTLVKRLQNLDKSDIFLSCHLFPHYF